MLNYKITIQYDGTKYHGWQSQPSGNTVQDEITRALKIAAREEIKLVGSGRTDSGVHALGQVANFNLVKEINIKKFLHSVNSILPNSISITKIEAVKEDFHARFDAKRRVYVYNISTLKSPFYKDFSYFHPVADHYEIDKLNKLSRILIGEHDFSSFCRMHTETENKVCHLHSIYWKKFRGLIIFRIEADRFLHGMVRTIVGTILRAYNQDDGILYLENILKSKNREKAADAVPAKGLFLFKVHY